MTAGWLVMVSLGVVPHGEARVFQVVGPLTAALVVSAAHALRARLTLPGGCYQLDDPCQYPGKNCEQEGSRGSAKPKPPSILSRREDFESREEPHPKQEKYDSGQCLEGDDGG